MMVMVIALPSTFGLVWFFWKTLWYLSGVNRTWRNWWYWYVMNKNLCYTSCSFEIGKYSVRNLSKMVGVKKFCWPYRNVLFIENLYNRFYCCLYQFMPRIMVSFSNVGSLKTFFGIILWYQRTRYYNICVQYLYNLYYLYFFCYTAERELTGSFQEEKCNNPLMLKMYI